MSTASTTADSAGPRAASPRDRVLAQAAFETRQSLSHGEQLLVSVILPALALIGLTLASSPALGDGRRIDVATAGVLALAVVSTAFTGAAIQLAYERRYGVLRYLGTTPLGRGGLLAAKSVATLAVLAVQVVVLTGLGLALGARPDPAGIPAALLALVLGAAAFGGLAVLIGGTLRAEGVLAVANLLWVLLLVGGGLLIPAERLPGGLGQVLQWLPSSALGDALRIALVDGPGTVAGVWPWADLLALAVWAAVLLPLARRLLRWSD